MIALSPLTRRIVYVMTFELFGIIFATILLSAMSGGMAHDSLPVAVFTSLAAVTWNFIYNTLFDAWEDRNCIRKRTLPLRAAHALGFEGGLALALIPFFMWWYSVDVLTALKMEIAILVFFLLYAFVFTLIFDQIVPRRLQ